MTPFDIIVSSYKEKQCHANNNDIKAFCHINELYALYNLIFTP